MLRKAFIFNVILLAVPIFPFGARAILAFGIASATFIYGTYKALILLKDIHDIGLKPNSGTLGWFYIAMNGIIFALSMLTPSIPGIKPWVQSHQTFWAVIAVLSYSNAVWCFYLMMHLAEVRGTHAKKIVDVELNHEPEQ